MHVFFDFSSLAGKRLFTPPKLGFGGFDPLNGGYVNTKPKGTIYPFFATSIGRIFSAILTLNGSNDVFLQPLVPFGGHVKTAPHLGVQIPQKRPFWGRE